MKVKELIALLQQHDQEAFISAPRTFYNGYEDVTITDEEAQLFVTNWGDLILVSEVDLSHIRSIAGGMTHDELLGGKND